MLTPQEKGHFLTLFTRGDDVLNFSRAKLNIFTLHSVGVGVCDVFTGGKAKVLSHYIINVANEQKCLKLLQDLLSYYEKYYQKECDKTLGSSEYDEECSDLYQKCKSAINRETGAIAEASLDYLKEQFSSQYLSAQLALLSKMRTENPTEAIGKAKELIESCCKTILEEQSQPISENTTISQLIKGTQVLLEVAPENVAPTMSDDDIVKRILGSLHGLAVGVAEFRNKYGSGHGKADSFTESTIRHAKLAVGSSATLCEYLWETYEWRIKQGKLKPRPRSYSV